MCTSRISDDASCLDFPGIYDRVSGIVYGQLLRHCNFDRLAAQRLSEEVFIRIFASFNSFKPAHGTRLSWINRIIITVAMENGYPVSRDFYGAEVFKN